MQVEDTYSYDGICKHFTVATILQSQQFGSTDNEGTKMTIISQK